MKGLGPFLLIALLAFAVALATPLLPGAPFATYFGPLPAPLAMLIVTGFGLAALHRLQVAGWTPGGWPAPRDLAGAASLGALFALPTVALDLALPFPEGINAPLPDALAFYPAIGFVAETVFHALPFALVSLVAPNRIALGVVAVALVEPVFQVAAGGGIDPRNSLMALILFGFSLAQLTALRRNGFAAAFAMRIGYYLIWHILWGAARLPLLYP